MVSVRELLELSSVPRIGHHKLRLLIAHFGSPGNALRASPRELTRVQGIKRTLASAIAHHRGGAKFADQQLRLVNRIGARIITIWDSEFPELLKRTYDPPAFMFVHGKFQSSDRHALAIVGTRAPSSYGQRVAEALAGELAQLGITVISGLARGIDTVAHAAALKHRGRTIAVIGSGLDVPYPPENHRLQRAISEQGTVVTEFPMGTTPDATNFPRRNRIISGLSLGTIIVESADDGGAMITASIALDQNREVFAIPGSIYEKRSSGPHRLIREGRAKLVQCVDDILEELGPQLRHLIHKDVPTPPLQDLSLFERRVYDKLGDEPLHIDALADAAGTTTADALVNLLSLEFKGLVRQLPGKMFLRV